MTSYLTCGFQVIKLPNERVIALFHHFLLQFLHVTEISGKAHNTTTSRPPVSCISQILTIILVDLGWIYKSTISKRSDKQWLRFKEGGPWPDMLAKMA